MNADGLLAAGLLAAGIGLGAMPGAAAEQEVTAQQVVSAMEKAFGVTPGERRNHIKGTCAAGQFVGLPTATAYSRSALFSGQPVPVVARFSLAGGNPMAPDTARTPRGMALEFRLDGGALQHMTMINTPVFGAAQPKTFFDQLLAMQPDPATGKPDPEKLKAFRASHPDSLAQAKFLEEHNPPASFANSGYFGLHTFRFVDRDGRTTPVRWRFVPQDGEHPLSDEELKTLPADFLERRLIERARQAPLRWDMVLTIGRPEDPQNDPSRTWPEDRQQVKVGTLTIDSATPQKGAACEKINYDPLVMADGIAPSDDPVLHFRSPSYAISFAKRAAGQ